MVWPDALCSAAHSPVRLDYAVCYRHNGTRQDHRQSEGHLAQKEQQHITKGLINKW